jgi:hypothetical protein
MKLSAILLVIPSLILLSGYATNSSKLAASSVRPTNSAASGVPASHASTVGTFLFGAVIIPILGATSPLWILDAAIEKTKYDAEQEKKAAAHRPEPPVNPLPQTS